MARRKRKIKNKFKKIEVIFILLTLFFLLSSCLISCQITSIKDNYQYLQKKRDSKKNKLLEKERIVDNLNERISIYKKADKSLDSIKKEYFSNIKKIEDSIIEHKSNRKIAYLTFDDGPYYNTYKVLDILDQYNVKATFFTISMNGEYCYDNKNDNCFLLYKEYLKRGHTIANHTYTHAIFNGLYSSTDSFMDSILRQEEHIKKYADGYSPRIVRFPGGSATAKGLKDSIIERLREHDYGWVDWSAKDGDGGGLKSWNEAWSIFTSSIDEDIEVVLFHDYNSITTEMLPSAIQYLLDNNYELYPLFYESNMIKK